MKGVLKQAEIQEITTNKMRLDYLKEIQFLRGILNPKKLPDDVIDDYLSVNFFNETEGYDPNIIKALNTKLKFLLQ